jgi:hypothetical protein
MPARHACADALASCAAPGSGARQTARSRRERRFARPARDCRCPRADGRPEPGRPRPVDPVSSTAAGAAAMPARHSCADALASCAAPGSGARQTARSRRGRRSARPARDCRCPRADGRPEPGRRRPVRPRITRGGRRGGDASEARMCRCAGEHRRAGIGRTADRAKPMRTPCPQGQQGTAGARALTGAPSSADHGQSDLRSRTVAGVAAMPARHVCADALASSDAPVNGRMADRAKPMRTQVRKAGKGLLVPARCWSPWARLRRPHRLRAATYAPIAVASEAIAARKKTSAF